MFYSLKLVIVVCCGVFRAIVGWLDFCCVWQWDCFRGGKGFIIFLLD